jgi:hypothetical protein
MAVAAKENLADQAAGKPLFFWVALLLGGFVLGLYIFAGAMIYRYGTVARPVG